MQYTQLSRRSAGGKIDWEKQYLTFIPVEDAVFSWAERAVSGHLEYSINGGQTWVTIADGESTPTVAAQTKILWRGDLRPTVANNDTGGIGTFSATANYYAKGNTMSLLYDDDFYGKQLNGSGFGNVFRRLFYINRYIMSAPLLPATTLATGCYQLMFYKCTSITTASELPATTLATRCYYRMFHECTSLAIAPELPATTLAMECYAQMFQYCTSLTTAPALPATTLALNCYSNMFRDCFKLTTAPELPATTLTDYCYNGMFQGCRNINYVKCLATDISASSCTSNWLKSVASTGTFVKDANTTWPTGTSGIPSGWTVVDDNA